MFWKLFELFKFYFKFTCISFTFLYLAHVIIIVNFNIRLIQVCTNHASKQPGFRYFQTSDYVTLLKSCMETNKIICCIWINVYFTAKYTNCIYNIPGIELHNEKYLHTVYIPCRTLKSYFGFLAVSLISFTNKLYNFAHTL